MKEHRTLGTGGPDVFPIGLGGASLSIAGRPPDDEGVRVVLRALELGATLIDTADAYCLDDEDFHHNERLVGRALSQWKDRDTVVVGTKAGIRRPGGRWLRDGRPVHLRAACEASLEALGVERIDLLQLHAPDPKVPMAESVGALDALRAEGKVRWIGVSNVNVGELAEARATASILTVQNAFSLWNRSDAVSGLLASCEAAGIAYIAHSPLGGHGTASRVGRREVEAVARELGATVAQVALAWLLARSPSIVPIPGTRSIDHVAEDISAAHLELSLEQAGRVGRATTGEGAVEGVVG